MSEFARWSQMKFHWGLRFNRGELGAMVMIDATVRLLPDVLGNNLSAQTDSHSTGLLSIHNIPDLLFSTIWKSLPC